VIDINANDLENVVSYVIRAHRDFPKQPEKSTRKWDKETPYSMHPIWCAMTILTETSLQKDLRYNGALALALHDIKEDTKLGLPEGLPEVVYSYVDGMTFPGSMEQEMKEIWDKPQEIRLFKLYDKTSNLLDDTWMSEDKARVYKKYTSNLVKDVERLYGELNIIKFARTQLR
jgi:hypothetical protein